MDADVGDSLERELEAALLAEVSQPGVATSVVAAPSVVNLAGVTLDDLEVESLLGEGGMGQVWKARDIGLDIPVALKVLPPQLSTDADYVARFLREARAVARLDHPNIVRVYQAGRREHNGGYLRVIVMEYVKGRDAHVLVRENDGLAPQRAAEIVLGAARALRYAHAKGVIHRDVKPANLLVPDDADGPAVKVLDFGLAALRAAKPGAVQLTQADAVMGSPHYMSPEQAGGKPVDARTDVYSLGISLYELLTGRTPFTGDTLFTLMKAHIEEPLSFPPEAFESVPPMYTELIRGMCAKAADDRLPLKAVIERLEDFLGISRPDTATPQNAAPEGPRTNLTPMPTSFVGRERELSELRQRLEGGAKLVTVMGPGGIGKTRFTREFGLSVAAEYPAGVWFCDLTEARSIEGICNGVGQGLSIPLTKTDPIALLHAALRSRGRMLLILDNFEQVTQHAAATLGVWLQDTPEVQFIASSREPLHLQGEWAFPLDALDTGGAPGSSAVELFCQRAMETRRDFKLDESNRETIARIVRELDGIPLAIELAAARVSAVSPQKILERLPRRFELLTSRRRDASARQQTLRNTIEWSWNLLQPHEQSTLAQCSVFRDGFFLEAAEAVIDLDAFPDAPLAMDVIESLVEKSLLRAYATPELPGEMRYRMYESIREFADWKMMDPNALHGATGPESGAALRLRHGRCYADYGEQWAERVPFRDGLEALNRLELEVENLLSIQDAFQQANPPLAAHAILAADAVLSVRGPWAGRIVRLEQAQAALPAGEDLAKVDLLAALSRAHYDCGTKEGMTRAAENAVAVATALATDVESRKRKAKALHMRGVVHAGRGEFDAALACYAEAEAISRELGHRAAIAVHVGNRGVVHASRGEFDAALVCFAEAEAIRRELGHRAGIAANVGNRGAVHLNRDEYDAALACYAEAEAIYRELGHRAGIALLVGSRGVVHLNRDEYDAALACYAEAEAINRELGHRAGVAINIGNRGIVHERRGEFDAALACYAQADAIFRELGHRASTASWIGYRGRCLHRMGRLEEAMAPLLEARDIREKLGTQVSSGHFEVLATLAKIHHELARRAESSGDANHTTAALQAARQAAEFASQLNLTQANPTKGIRKALAWIDEILAG